ncbi:TatD family hydrolase [Guggenheimella bovis]
MIYDTHAHLNDEAFQEDLETLIESFSKEGVGKVLLPAVSMKEWEGLIELKERYDVFEIAFGIHPSEVQELKDVQKLEDMILRYRPIAVGEIGLDYHWTTDDWKEQQELFKAQLEIAKKHKLPVLIHDREAHQDVRKILDEVGSYETGVVLHSYSGSLEWAMEYIERGAYISLGGPVTFKNSKEPKRVAAGIPLERLLVETDSPYLTPTPFRGKRNDPTKVRYILDEIALLREMDRELLEETTYKNAERFFCRR